MSITETLADLTGDERADWLTGAGFVPGSTIRMRGAASSVWLTRPGDDVPAGWPSAVGIIEADDGALRITAYGDAGEVIARTDVPADAAAWDCEFGDYDPDCRCSGCAEANAEDAALRRVGQ